ncbi:MAG TPA: RNA-binding cell elongation regulator Jag/EloR [Spirochaetia bacterium]|nr:RNA-binding cell elongation regulator Jag/EloR [Spirochaetia bacterium]
MIVKEFEGKNEKEAIDRAIEELGLDRNEIDFEIVEAKRPGILFRGGKVKIRVHLAEDQEEANLQIQDQEMEERIVRGAPVSTRPRSENLPPDGEFEHKVLDFTHGLLERMGFPAEVAVNFREDGRLGVNIESDGSGILIGKQGKTLEALQFIVNLAVGRMGGDSTRIVLDTQDYRSRRERSLIRMANHVAEQVRKSRSSRLLEPLNPFERRLIHTSLARYGDIETVSEGDGLYKRIRVIWRDGREQRRE